jgi:hypothetical protein
MWMAKPFLELVEVDEQEFNKHNYLDITVTFTLLPQQD